MRIIAGVFALVVAVGCGSPDSDEPNEPDGAGGAEANESGGSVGTGGGEDEEASGGSDDGTGGDEPSSGGQSTGGAQTGSGGADDGTGGDDQEGSGGAPQGSGGEESTGGTAAMCDDRACEATAFQDGTHYCGGEPSDPTCSGCDPGWCNCSQSPAWEEGGPNGEACETRKEPSSYDCATICSIQ